jgi:hypothetical protein
MGLFDGYFDQDQFQDGGGLLGRLLSLQQQQGQYQPGTGFDQVAPVAQMAESAMPWPDLLNYRQLSSAPRIATQDQLAQHVADAATSEPYSSVPNPNSGDVQKIGITSDQSIYCRTMRKLCHNQCFEMIFGRDAFGPYRACVRTCMHNAGCFDF